MGIRFFLPVLLWTVAQSPALAQAPCVSHTRSVSGCAVPGAPVTVTVTLNSTCPESVNALGLRESIPPGWTLAATGGADAPNFSSAIGAGGTLDFGWVTVPSFPATFTYTLGVPTAEAGGQTITGMALYREDGGEISGATVDTAVCFSAGGPGDGCVAMSRALVGDCATAGGAVTIAVTLNGTCQETLTALGVRETLPAGWTLGDVGGASPPDFASAAGAAGEAEFGWVDIPTFPATFTYTLLVPASESQARAITGMPAYRESGDEVAGDDVTTAICFGEGGPGGPGAPSITLLGAAIVAVECGQAYVEAGATAVDGEDGDLTANIVIGGSVNANLPGSYTVTYNVVDSDNNPAPQVTRQVMVRDTTPPVIALSGPTTLTHGCGTPFTDFGATATDGCDGNPTVAVSGSVDVDTPGTYILTYTATDAAGLFASTTRTVTVADIAGPVITPMGGNPLHWECGTPYRDPGATAQDACDGLEANVITVANNVNGAVPGTYTVTYSATDSGGRVSGLTREVIVADTTAPAIQIAGAATMTVPCGVPFADPGATATDNCDANPGIPESDAALAVNTSRAGTYTVTYSLSDAAGNMGTATRTVIVGGPSCENASNFCAPASFDVIQPMTDRVFVADGANVSRILFSSVVGGPETAACEPGTIRVTYTVDGTSQSSMSAETGYAAVYFLAQGDHTVRAEAAVLESGDALVQEFVLSVAPATDGDGDGFLDQPLVALLADGDSWTAGNRAGGSNGQVAMITWDGDCDGEGGDTVELRLRNPDDSGQILAVGVDRALLACGERGILAVALGRNLQNILSATEADKVGELPAGVADNAPFFDISIVISDDGETFRAIPASRVASRPVRFSLSGLNVPAGVTPRFMHFPTNVQTSGAFRLAAGSGAWTETALRNVRMVGGILHGEATGLSLFVPLTAQVAPVKEGGASCAPGRTSAAWPLADGALMLGVLLVVMARSRTPLEARRPR